jgi:hypothetical protein
MSRRGAALPTSNRRRWAHAASDACPNVASMSRGSPLIGPAAPGRGGKQCPVARVCVDGNPTDFIACALAVIVQPVRDEPLKVERGSGPKISTGHGDQGRRFESCPPADAQLERRAISRRIGLGPLGGACSKYRLGHAQLVSQRVDRVVGVPS